MPKKRTYNFKTLQGKSSSNSNSTSSKPNENAGSSVNERLSELRKLEAKDAAAKKRELADSVNKRSVPPQVQGLLGVPESAPPKPKAGVRTRERLRTPGPAPPKSWIERGSGCSSGLNLAMRGPRRGFKKSTNRDERRRPRELLRFARLSGFEKSNEGRMQRSLTHITLKTIAESWDLFDEDDYPTLIEIPLRLRLRLLSYIAFYGPPIDALGLQALLQGSERIEALDLTSLLGHANLTLKKVTKALARPEQVDDSQPKETIAESWDAEETFEQSLRPAFSINRAAHITHLCLSHPGPHTSWRDLLVFTKTTPQVTHLSLPYWPWPSRTPNLATTTVSSQHSPEVTASASSYYAALDQDFEEPISVLRQLSSYLLCLQWLDIEGCQQWAPALAGLAKEDAVEANGGRRDDVWHTADSERLPILASNWKNLSHLHIAQGWVPTVWGVQSIIDRASTEITGLMLLVGKGVIDHLEHNCLQPLIPPEGYTQDMIDADKKRARLWLQAETKITHACMHMAQSRHQHKCKSIEFDYGWTTRQNGIERR